MLDLFYLAIGVVGFLALWAITKALRPRVGGRPCSTTSCPASWRRFCSSTSGGRCSSPRSSEACDDQHRHSADPRVLRPDPARHQAGRAVHVAAVPGRAHVPASRAAADRGARLQAVRRPRGSGTAVDAVRRVAAVVQPLRLPVRVRAPAAPGLSAAESAGVRHGPGASRPGVQHRHQLHDEHELAGVQRRIDDELPRPDGRPGRAELRVRGGRHRGRHRADPRLRAAGDRPDRELLGRPDARDALRVDADRRRRGPRVLLAGRHPELPPVHRRQDGRRRDADHCARARRVAGSHQAARHQRRRLLQRQLGAPLREPDAVHEPRADPVDLRARAPASPTRSATWSRTPGRAGRCSPPWP